MVQVTGNALDWHSVRPTLRRCSDDASSTAPDPLGGCAGDPRQRYAAGGSAAAVDRPWAVLALPKAALTRWRVSRACATACAPTQRWCRSIPSGCTEDKAAGSSIRRSDDGVGAGDEERVVSQGFQGSSQMRV